MKKVLALCLSAFSFTASSATIDLSGMSVGSAARAEFFELKAQGQWTSYLGEPVFPWLPNLHFVYLEKAQRDRRLCFFGVFESQGTVLTSPTRFLCVNEGRLTAGTSRPMVVPRCKDCDNPTPSIGIGNLRTTPADSIQSFSQPEEYPLELPLNFEMIFSKSGT